VFKSPDFCMSATSGRIYVVPAAVSSGSPIIAAANWMVAILKTERSMLPTSTPASPYCRIPLVASCHGSSSHPLSRRTRCNVWWHCPHGRTSPRPLSQLEETKIPGNGINIDRILSGLCDKNQGYVCVCYWHSQRCSVV
jgi:hypothetical protein